MEKTGIKNKSINYILNFLKENWFLILIIIIGAFFRLYKIGEYMTFLGDEGRDVIIVRNLLVKADPILIGPGTSVGGMYLGPLYYYFMAPFLFLAGYSPVGPAIGVALLSVTTIYLVYLAGRDWFSKTAGLIAAVLYAIAPTVIIYSRSSWNPNIMPFFALLAVYSVWRAWKEKEAAWVILTSISLAFVLQSHYLGVLLVPVIFVFICLLLKEVRKNKIIKSQATKFLLFSLTLFTLLMSPLVLFDFRHGFLNSKALYKFLTIRQETVSIKPWTAIPKSYPIFEEINTSLITAKEPVGKIVTFILTLWSVYMILKKRKDIRSNSGFYIIILWITFALIGFGIYKQPIYDHYFGFLFPASFLLTAFFLTLILESKFKIFGVIALGILIYVNLINNPLQFSPNMQMNRSINVANKILEVTNGKPFNLAVLAERNYEDGYRYFLDINDAIVLHADVWDKSTISDTLMVVCEMEKSKCDPTHSPEAEVANFGWSKIENEWIVDGVIIYKLIHSN
jgi:4-amino-4-deoxy-L-arabinose transferase-like glycosyltransferase